MTVERIRDEQETPVTLGEKLGKEGLFTLRRIPLDWINTLPQPRQTFEEIEELAENIALRGLINPLTVVRFSAENAKRHLEKTANLWKTNLQLKSLKGVVEGNENFYYILISGERRLRALRHLQTLHSQEFHIPVSLCEDISSEEFFFLQVSENIHKQVPPHEQALAYVSLLRTRREENPKYPLAQFARDVGRSESKIRTDLRFCELPSIIQDFIVNDQLAYGIGDQLARLQPYYEDEKLKEEKLKSWAVLAMAGNYTVREFRKAVTNEIRQREFGQTMLGLFEEEQEKVALRLKKRWVVARNMVRGLAKFNVYFRNVNSLFEKGLLGEEESPFSEGSPVRIFLAAISAEEGSLSYLRTLASKSRLTKKEGEKSEAVLREARSLLELIERSNPS